MKRTLLLIVLFLMSFAVHAAYDDAHPMFSDGTNIWCKQGTNNAVTNVMAWGASGTTNLFSVSTNGLVPGYTAPQVGNFLSTSGWVENAVGYVMRPVSTAGAAIGGTYDWTTVDFTHDGAWHTISLPALVPTNARALNVYFFIKSTGASHEFDMAGNTGLVSSVLGSMTVVANQVIYGDGVLGLDGTNRVIYYVSTLAGTSETQKVSRVRITGWWF